MNTTFRWPLRSARPADPAARPGGRPASAHARRRIWRLASIALVLAVAWIDRASGNQISFSLFYVIPVAAAAWYTEPVTAITAALLAAGGWIVDRIDTALPAAVLYWNALAETAMYAGIALAVSALRRDAERRAADAAALATAYGRLDQEMRRVAELQRGLLPARIPPVDGASILAHYAPCERSGGDYFDVFALPAGRIGLLIADASGHGAPAAVLMAMTRILLHTRDLGALSPDALLARLHLDLSGNLPAGQFVTACYAVFDPATDRIEFASAGHPPPLRRRGADGAIERLENRSGLPLGVPVENRFDTAHTTLAPGDAVVFYTDGLTEARDALGAELGEAPLGALLTGAPDGDPAGMLQALVAAQARHTAGVPAADDTTIVLLRVDPPASAMREQDHERTAARPPGEEERAWTGGSGSSRDSSRAASPGVSCARAATGSPET